MNSVDRTILVIPVHPGGVLAEEIEVRGVTATELSRLSRPLCPIPELDVRHFERSREISRSLASVPRNPCHCRRLVQASFPEVILRLRSDAAARMTMEYCCMTRLVAGQFDLVGLLSRVLGVHQCRISNILRKQTIITADTALRLGRWTGTGPELWLNLQKQYELRRAMIEVGDEIERVVVPASSVAH